MLDERGGWWLCDARWRIGIMGWWYRWWLYGIQSRGHPLRDATGYINAWDSCMVKDVASGHASNARLTNNRDGLIIWPLMQHRWKIMQGIVFKWLNGHILKLVGGSDINIGPRRILIHATTQFLYANMLHRRPSKPLANAGPQSLNKIHGLTVRWIGRHPLNHAILRQIGW